MITVKKISLQEIVNSYFKIVQELRPHIKTENNLEKILKQITKSEAVIFWGIEKEGIPVGFASSVFRYGLAQNGKYCFIYDLVITEKQRSRQLGKQLLVAIIKDAKNSGCVSIELESGTSRASAHKFYFKNNFHISSYNFVAKL